MIKLPSKGFSPMHDTALTPVTEEVALPRLAPRTPSLTDHLLQLLAGVLLLAENDSHALMASSRRRGRPATLSLSHLALGLLVGVLHGSRHLTTIWRRLSLEPIGPFSAVSLTYEAVRKRLLIHGVAALEQLFEQVSQGLASCSQSLHPSACRLAPFASQLLALDETTLDRLRRLTEDLRHVPSGDPHLLPGKLAALFDLRTQRFVRVQFRACSTGWLLAA
jgi:hypothetical protein